jgi:hypothetical protein
MRPCRVKKINYVSGQRARHHHQALTMHVNGFFTKTPEHLILFMFRIIRNNPTRLQRTRSNRIILCSYW